MANEIPKQIGPYQIIEQLGKGGMAVVYKAVQTTLNRTVAVKVLPQNMSDPGWAERFHREAQAVAMLNHPNIVQIIDKDEADGVLYFAMEYVPGCSLDKIMARRRLSLSEVLKIFKEVARGLEYAHQHRIIHRDLNPRNVLVSEDLSKVKLADFGICRVESISSEMGTLSTREVSFGTLHYLAPEQAANMVKSDHRSDIFSLGVLFYEMLTGKVPVGRFSLPSRLNAEVPPELDPIVLKCLASEPADRYQSVTQVLNQLNKVEENLRLKLVDELKGFSRSTSNILKKSTESFGRRTYTGLVIGAAGAGLLAVVLFFFLRGGETVVPPTMVEGEAAREVAAAPQTTPLPGGTPETGTVPAATPPADSSGLATPPSAPLNPPSPPATGNRSARPAANPVLIEARQKFEAGQLEPALQDINGLLGEQPDGPAALDGLFLKAEILKGLKRVPDEKAVYSEITQRFQGHQRHAEAAYQLAEILRGERGEGWQQQALDLFRAVGASDSPFAAAALLRQGEVEGILKLTSHDDSLNREVPAALVTYRRLVGQYPESPSAEYAFWSLGNMYRDADQFELAAQMFSELGTRFASSQWDAWWVAGELYEEKIRNNALALEAYSKVPASSRNYQRAQRKLTRLKP